MFAFHRLSEDSQYFQDKLDVLSCLGRHNYIYLDDSLSWEDFNAALKCIVQHFCVIGDGIDIQLFLPFDELGSRLSSAVKFINQNLAKGSLELERLQPCQFQLHLTLDHGLLLRYVIAVKRVIEAQQEIIRRG